MLTYQIMDLLDMPVFITFLDSNYTHWDAWESLMSKLHSIAHQYPQILFTFIDKEKLYFLKNKVGISWEEMPSLGLFNNEGIAPIIFPRNQPFTSLNLYTFFDWFMNGSIYNKNFSLPDANIDFGENMKHAFQVELVS